MYFDCLCEVGPRSDKDPAAPWSVRDVLRWMDHCGIDGALVGHTLTRTNDLVDARRRLSDEIAVAPKRLFPLWSIVPPDAGDIDESPDDLLKAMEEANARAIKLFPRSHIYPFLPALIAPFMETLAAHGIPVLLDYPELPDGSTAVFTAMDDFLSAFPRLDVVLQRASWGCQRIVTALMGRHLNLHLELSKMQHNRGIEVYLERFGADRLLFGTGLPAMSAGAARAWIDYAQISDDAKEKIAGGNLSRLLRGLTPRRAAASEPDTLRDLARRGRPLAGIEVLDAHCHVLHEGADSVGGYVMYRGDGDGLVELMDVTGVDTTALMSWVGPLGCDMVEGNDIVARAMAKHPGRFLGVAYINPSHHSRDELMAEVRKRVEDQDFVGLKPYHNLGLKYNDDLFAPCWEYANDRGLYALCHIGGKGGGVDVIGELAERYRGMQWIIPHTGGSFGMARQVAGVMKSHPNIWAELTLTPVTNGVIEWLAGEVGDDRILFGTDAPMRDPRPQFGWVVWSDLPEKTRRRILGGNFRRLLGMRRA